MQKMQADLNIQYQTSFDLINSKSTSTEQKVYLESTLHSRIVMLIEKHKILQDQMQEVETNIDRWTSQHNTLPSFAVIDGLELDQQDWQVQELVNLLNQVTSLRYFKEKLMINIYR